MIKTDKSLEEVWVMKEKVYEDFKKSNFNNFADYIENSTKEIREKYNIKYHKANIAVDKQLPT
jgi:hypothetical protein